MRLKTSRAFTPLNVLSAANTDENFTQSLTVNVTYTFTQLNDISDAKCAIRSLFSILT